MLVQEKLNGELNEPWESKDCCEACWFARQEECECRCGGANHGRGRYIQELMNDDPILTWKIARPFDEKITRHDCICGNSLVNQPIHYYGPHDGGWTVPGFLPKLWLYKVCPKCGYQMALWKMGVSKK